MIRKSLLLMLTAAALAADDAAPVVVEQPAAFSVWLDFPSLSRPETRDPALPIWFESFGGETFPATDWVPPRTVFRLRVRRMPALHRELLLRVFFDDMPGVSPVVSAWSETGRVQFQSEKLGQGTGLPTHESMVVPLADTDYLEIEVPGDGSTVRGALASSLREVAVRETIDFQHAAAVEDPFGNLPAATPGEMDVRLFGRVKATLDFGTVPLSFKETPSAAWEFELASQPLAAVVTFDVLGADLHAPPVVLANDGTSVFASIRWPDLADPGYRGESRGDEAAMRFHYTGWLRAQCVVPRATLRAGLNKIVIGVSDGSGPIAIRNVELQLKQNWEHFDYILTPAKR